MTRFLLLFCLCIHALCAAETNRLIVIYGASCAGKSSLSFALQEALGSPWIVIDRDDVIENEEKKGLMSSDAIEEMADTFLCHEIQEAQKLGQNVIVDIQLPLPILGKFTSQNPLAVFVYAPLPFLIARDKKRAELRQRSADQARKARHYVLETYAALLCEEHDNNKRVDTVLASDLECDMFRLPLSERTTGLFLKLIRRANPSPLYANFPCDVLIKSHQESLKESVKRCLAFLPK
jgi:predicted ATPase